VGLDARINVVVPVLLCHVWVVSHRPDATSDSYPFVLQAGERRAYTANTIYRDAAWRRKDMEGALRMSPQDAQRLGIENGGRARVTTKVGSALTLVEVNERMLPGHLSLPNGFGLDNEDGQRIGVAPNELTSLDDRDRFAGTPWHKYVPARIEAVG
jgi:anaerobic selenocysteine-containing dehydrogenase